MGSETTSERVRRAIEETEGNYLATCAEVADEMVKEAVERLTSDAAPLTFALLHEVNGQRCARWHEGMVPWVGSDWSNAMQGEAGEAGNVVKKMRRLETRALRKNRFDLPDLTDVRLSGSYLEEYEMLRRDLGEELADTILYADLTARFYDIDLPGNIVRKFNRVSIERGFPERLQEEEA